MLPHPLQALRSEPDFLHVIKYTRLYIPQQAANGRRVEEPHSPEFTQVLRLLQEIISRGWTLYRAEVNIFSCVLCCAGQPDLVCRDLAGDLVIVDWKRIAKLPVENKFAALRYPFHQLPCTSYWKYALQLQSAGRNHGAIIIHFPIF